MTTCIWTYVLHDFDYGPYWDTACGESFMFEDGDPTENGFKFCPYCGGTLEMEVEPPDAEDAEGGV